MIRHFHSIAREVDNVLALHEKVKSIIRYDETVFENLNEEETIKRIDEKKEYV